MLPPLRRALPGLACAALVLAGCGGAGYGDPIAATDGDGATVALAPAPVTTPDTAGGTAAPGDAGPSAPSDAPPATTTTGDGAPSGGGGDDAPADGGAAGDDDRDGGGGSGDDELAAYAADANRFCKGFNAATKALTTEVGAAGTSNPKALGQAIVRYGDAVSAAAEGIEAAPPPPAVRSYHQRTLSWVSGLTDVIDANRSGLQSGSTSAGVNVIQKVQSLGKPPTAPPSLRSRATACAS